MKLIDITALGIRLVGIMMLINCVSEVTSAIMQTSTRINYDGSTGYIVGIWIACIFIILVSALLIKFPNAVAKMVVPSASHDSPEITCDAKPITIAGFTIIGVFILSGSIPDLVHNFLELYKANKFTPNDSGFKFEIWLFQISTVFEIGVGLYLVLGSSGLYRAIQRLRG